MKGTVTGILLIFFLCTRAYGSDGALWERYKSSFLSNDGRIIDYSQSLVSHSEAQGYGMLLAVAYNDKESFDRIWRWTGNNLSVRSDNLFAWEWGKRPNGQWAVIDYNNATDGDILIAYALLKAKEKWHDGGYRNTALKVIKDIRTQLAITWKNRVFLLPGYDGFVKDAGFVLNPSYFIFPAFHYFAREDDKAFWDNVYKESVSLVTDGCFGRLCLPADWVVLDMDGVSIFKGKRPYFGANAVRTILNMACDDGERAHRFPEGLRKILEIYKNLGYIPLWVDLDRDSLSIEASPAGYYAIYALAAKKEGDEGLSERLLEDAKKRLAGETGDYYSFSLYLLATSEALY